MFYLLIKIFNKIARVLMFLFIEFYLRQFYLDFVRPERFLLNTDNMSTMFT